MVITNDRHYIKKEHSRVHDILLLGGTDSTLEDANDPTKKIWQFNVKDLYIKTPDGRGKKRNIPLNRTGVILLILCCCCAAALGVPPEAPESSWLT